MISDKTIERIRQFVKDRNWDQFHTDVNLAKSIVLEASEVLELFQWSDEVQNEEDLKDELADVLTYIIQLCDKKNYDMDEIINNKLDKTIKKYPVEKAYGKSDKYCKL